MPKYPFGSTLLTIPGDRGPGEGLELFMLTLLELWWLLPFFIRARLKLMRLEWKLIRLACAGEGCGGFCHSIPGLCVAAPMMLLLSREAAGVFITGSSASRSMAMSSSEDTSVSESESSILTLLTELERWVRSGMVDQSAAEALLGESRTVLPPILRLCGILTPLPVTGEASGEEMASVEWCRFVHALV